MKTINTILVGAYIQGLREGSKYGQIEFAKELDITQSSLSRMEAGKNFPSLKTMFDISNLLELSSRSVEKFLGINAVEYIKYKKEMPNAIDSVADLKETRNVLEEILEKNPCLDSKQRVKIISLLKKIPV